MRRRLVHYAFGVTALTCAALAAYQGLHLYRSDRINAAVASARMSSFDAAVPEARFARALALARSGEAETAQKIYKTLTRERRHDLRQRARYNLGNLYMRAALSHGANQALQSLPLIELAKQNYRDLLRETPADWDARYNLERALQLAPEVEQADDEEQPPRKEPSVSTLRGARIDLP